MRIDRDTASWIDLSLVPGLGPSAYCALLKVFGFPQEVLRAKREQLARVVPEALAARIVSEVRTAHVEQALEWLSSDGHALVTLADTHYPKLLLQISDPPPLLYLCGNPLFLARPALAIVGSRNATPQGSAIAKNFARALSQAGLTIVSGLALGIDTAAHRGALAGTGSTVAVLGTGANMVYPRANEALAREIACHGAIVSEFPLSTPPLAGNFPRRNRLISALAKGCMVVEAAVSSGSLITARFAVEQGREVFAVPSSIHSPLARGCHALIKQGAKLVESARDVLEELHFGQAVIYPKISASNDELLQYMGFDPCNMDSLVQRSGLTAQAVSAMLLQLELEGSVGSLPGGLYQRIS